ncbi:glutamic acid-rich protein [Scophthalmus maximus]|uniref:glutamic acid-rich protein n=1 Tax=Scophthalmus maximus TaxID=52904 RepID=UPI001FA89C7F|nr:glutamic acid-rich protein [Scophthalmus maximus]
MNTMLITRMNVALSPVVSEYHRCFRLVEVNLSVTELSLLEWTDENLQKLYAAMKSNLPEQSRTCSYFRVLKGLDWTSVAFPPFSAEECQAKWGQVLHKARNDTFQKCSFYYRSQPNTPTGPVSILLRMRKYRSLTELIDEAECVLSNTHQQSEAVVKCLVEPKMPARSGNSIFVKDQMALLKEQVPNARNRFLKANQNWNDLSTEEKKCYKIIVQQNAKKYSMDLHEWFKTLTAAEQEGYRTSNPRKYKYIEAIHSNHEREEQNNHDMEDQNNHEVEDQNNHNREELCPNRPSDSEDEDIEDSSSDEEEDDLDSDEDEEEDEGVITFEMY